MSQHRIRWYGRIAPGDPDYPDGWVPRTRHMPYSGWGWDAKCSCGWQTRTGGAIAERIKEEIEEHKWEAQR